MTEQNVILDNGAYTAKVGLSTSEKPIIVPNAIMKAKSERRRAFIANQIDECRDASGLFYILGFQKGFLLNWDVQKSVWDHIFSVDCSEIILEDSNLLITEPQLNFVSIQEAMLEIFFEEYHCGGICKTTTADLAAFNYASENNLTQFNCIIIDVGYSFTHVVPFLKGKRRKQGIRRIDIGGKVLTNHLKEIISYRHLNVMDESYVVNQIKEDICYVSKDFNADMKIQANYATRGEIAVEYVLPDFTAVKRGFIRTSKGAEIEQQSIKLCNERFTIPELLFNPSDVGINQVGVPEAVMDCLNDCPKNSHSELLKNIVVIGGSSMFPGFMSRLKAEIRTLAPHDLQVTLINPEDPIAYGWYGGKLFSKSKYFESTIITREEYEENGINPEL